MMKVIKGRDLGIALISRNRSGYEGCIFLVKDDERNTITAKSNLFDELYPQAVRLPVVSFDNAEIQEIEDMGDGTYNIEYHFFNRMTRDGVTRFGRWFIRNGIKFDGIRYSPEQCRIRVENARFEEE